MRVLAAVPVRRGTTLIEAVLAPAANLIDQWLHENSLANRL